MKDTPIVNVQEELIDTQHCKPSERHLTDEDKCTMEKTSLKLLSSLTGVRVSKQQIFVAGGIQQLLNKQSITSTHSATTITTTNQNPLEIHILDLPNEVYLHVFSYLNPLDLCQMSEVCRQWYKITTDNHLWSRRLLRDSKKWSSISSKSNPLSYDLVQSDRSKKEIYLTCSPDIRRCTTQIDDSINYFFKLSDYVKGLFYSKDLIMFGPGLESLTSPSKSLVTKLLWDETKTFETMGMIPGKDGFGSGIKIKLRNHLFNLITLYTNCMKERENRSDRFTSNRLVQQIENNQNNNSMEDNSLSKYEVNPQVRDVCRDASGLVYVIDAAKENSLYDYQTELQIIMSEQWMNPSLPLLILACVKDEHTPRSSALDVVKDLNLSRLANPWLVQNCCVDNMKGIDAGFWWLLSTRSLLWIKNDN
ncbi:unnamed protein product [Didymodactylos carnosus]|uniref:F-box domain-containing protein n=1 Tax=Didymodactylos carnosus TaxID=1234261 RepID=A0A813ZHE5_9BILA|nr:unnamed protein product [Didymodactylos carnosus]CAF0921993.1 unnamed protein product [Didymodactylos carnosus]CAF3681621.1 unnamed protein product [Didymodactylos carnosus]CAF3699385.1 unnamed protein product [Didymodactylos carnosus]